MVMSWYKRKETDRRIDFRDIEGEEERNNGGAIKQIK